MELTETAIFGGYGGENGGLKPFYSRSRLTRLTKALDILDNEDDFLQKANSDISQLCAENILQWNKFLGKEDI